jgi:NAD(P)-dependent dehydrogenase (short-subunit alcohol dehydrogenase family)
LIIGKVERRKKMGISSFSLEGRVALVTGAGGVLGMGRGTALAFADAGADVVVTDLIAEAANWDLRGTAGEIRKLGRRSLAVQADLTKESEVASLVKKAVQEFGTIDILANVAGVPANAPLMEMTNEIWYKGIDINLSSVLHLCQSVGKVMMEHKRGSIINWSSSAAFTMGGLSIYGITKIGIMHMTGWVARELAPYNVRCNAIAPGIIKTDFGFIGVEGIREDGTPRTKMNYDALDKTIPLGRSGDASDVADVALFLASDASRYITGQTIRVDGGIAIGGRR